MKLLIAVIAALLLSGCQASKDYSIYNQAKHNFIYESDKDDELRLYNRIDRKFKGDCEDFAFTLQKQIGGEVWKVILTDESMYPWHAVLVKDGFVYDYLYEKSRVDDYPAKFIRSIISSKASAPQE